MDDIDERIAFGRLAEPLLQRLGVQGTTRDEVVAELWRERASLTRWLPLIDDAASVERPSAGH